ncbi:unnamed protein product, partial [Ranitomeya imitator]
RGGGGDGVTAARAEDTEQQEENTTHRPRHLYILYIPRSAAMTSQSQGIQQLLQAEKRAAERVSEARKRKARRLKQAKEEAQGEIEQYRIEREREFQSQQRTVRRQRALGTQGFDLSSEIEARTRHTLQMVQSSHGKNKEVVLRRLLSLVCDVKPELHANYRFTNY